MKPLILIAVVFLWTHSYSQGGDVITLAFKDKSNFDITTSFDYKKTTKYFVLTTTDKWNSNRFHLKENIKSDSVRKRLSGDEHHPYNHSYIFKDTALERLFNDTEKENLYQRTQIIKPRQLTDSFNEFSLINSFRTAKNGFLFSITDPIFSSDKLFAFLDITTYKKDKETKELNDTYFGTTLLIYQYIKGKGWTRIKKIDYLIL